MPHPGARTRALVVVLAAAIGGLLSAAPAGADQAELVGVTADGFEATWSTPAPGDSTVCVTPQGGGETCTTTERGTTMHRVVVGGLRPGTAHAYRLRTNGRDEARDVFHPGRLRTLTPPPGRHVSTIAVINDLHVGETCSGRLFGVGDLSFPPCNTADRYGARMLEAAGAQIRASGADLVLVNGDLTDAGGADETREAKRLLDGIGVPYAVTRGNHDRPDQGKEDGRCGAAKDCFNAVFRPGETRRVAPVAVEHDGVRYLLLDGNDPAGKGDLTDPAQQAWTARELADHRTQRTFVLVHEPPNAYSNEHMLQPGFGVPLERGGAWLRDLLARHPQVSGVLSGHTHRNFLAYDARTGRLPYVENGALKEYPAGFMLLRIHEGGWTREFHRVDCDAFCRSWTGVTRNQTFGTQATYVLGQLRSRSFTQVDDCDRLTPPQTEAFRVDGDAGDSRGCRGRLGFPIAAPAAPADCTARSRPRVRSVRRVGGRLVVRTRAGRACGRSVPVVRLRVIVPGRRATTVRVRGGRATARVPGTARRVVLRAEGRDRGTGPRRTVRGARR